MVLKEKIYKDLGVNEPPEFNPMVVLRDAGIGSRFVLSSGAYIDEHFSKYANSYFNKTLQVL